MTGSRTEIAGIVSLVGLAGVVGSLGYLHLAPTGLSPVANAVSQYGITEYRFGYRVATVSFGVAGIALAVGLHAALPASGTSAVVAFLAVFAAGRLVISWFPMDAPGSPRTSTGQAHGLIASAPSSPRWLPPSASGACSGSGRPGPRCPRSPLV